jgi:hypothetical protein
MNVLLPRSTRSHLSLEELGCETVNSVRLRRGAVAPANRLWRLLRKNPEADAVRLASFSFILYFAVVASIGFGWAFCHSSFETRFVL